MTSRAAATVRSRFATRQTLLVVATVCIGMHLKQRGAPHGYQTGGARIHTALNDKHSLVPVATDDIRRRRPVTQQPT